MPVLCDESNVDGLAFHVLGVYRNAPVVGHVGLLAGSGAFSLRSAKVAAYQSRPPLMVGVAPGAQHAELDSMVPEIVGWLEDLSYEERLALETWKESIATMVSGASPVDHKERIAREYTLAHTDDVIDPVDGSIQYRRFSCAGFVYCCYHEGAGIALVDINALPALDASAVSVAMSINPRFLELKGARLGLQGPGPWRLLAPAYIFHALSRRSAEARRPYKPSVVDVEYPRTESAEAQAAGGES